MLYWFTGFTLVGCDPFREDGVVQADCHLRAQLRVIMLQDIPQICIAKTETFSDRVLAYFNSSCYITMDPTIVGKMDSADEHAQCVALQPNFLAFKHVRL